MKWVIALCCIIVAFIFAIVSMQEAALNRQLNERQRELGYTLKKRSFSVGKRFISLLFTAVALLVIIPTFNPQPVTVSVMNDDPSLRSRGIDSQPAIYLNRVELSEKVVELNDYQPIGTFVNDETMYSVYLIENELVFQDSSGKTYINQLK